MNKKLKIALIILSSIILLTLLLVITISIIKHPDCYKTGGIWRTFPATCGDCCGAKGLGQAFTASCDCGPDKCWDGTKCQPDFSIDERCKWKFNGLCDYLTREGYYFNEETKKCEYYGRSSGCSDPPFRTLQECKTICES